MKSFAVTLVIFFLLIAFVIFNYVVMNRYSECLRNMTDALPSIESDDYTDKINELTAEWKKHRCFISFSTGISALQSIDDMLDSILIAANTGNVYEFRRIKALLINAFDGIAQFESFSPDDIF